MSVYDRIKSILDEDSFVEISKYICNEDGENPVVTGYGSVNGILTFIYAHNEDICSKSFDKLSAGKILDIYDRALSQNAPIIALIDSKGINVNDQNTALFNMGELIKKVSTASKIIPTISIITGSAMGLMALVATLSDFTFMLEGDSSLFVNSPDAIIGSFKDKLDTSAAKYREEVGDISFSASMDEIVDKCRSLISYLMESDLDTGDNPNREVEFNTDTTMSEFICEIADNNSFLELKNGFTDRICTGFMRLNGRSVGVVANINHSLCNKGALKTAEFTALCNKMELPLVVIVDTDEIDRDLSTDKEILMALKSLVNNYTDALIPKITLIKKNAIGLAGMVMGSKAIGADYVIALDDAKVSSLSRENMQNLNLENDGDLEPIVSAAKGYIDDIIPINDARQSLCASLEMLSANNKFRF